MCIGVDEPSEPISKWLCDEEHGLFCGWDRWSDLWRQNSCIVWVIRVFRLDLFVHLQRRPSNPKGHPIDYPSHSFTLVSFDTYILLFNPSEAKIDTTSIHWETRLPPQSPQPLHTITIPSHIPITSLPNHIYKAIIHSGEIDTTSTQIPLSHSFISLVERLTPFIYAFQSEYQLSWSPHWYLAFLLLLSHNTHTHLHCCLFHTIPVIDWALSLPNKSINIGFVKPSYRYCVTIAGRGSTICWWEYGLPIWMVNQTITLVRNASISIITNGHLFWQLEARVSLESENRNRYHRFKEIGWMIEILVVESINYSLHSFSSIGLPIPFPLLSSILLLSIPFSLAARYRLLWKDSSFWGQNSLEGDRWGSSKMVEDT